MSQNPLSLPDAPSREVALHLWPSGAVQQTTDWRAVQSVLRRRRALLLGVFGATFAGLILLQMIAKPRYNATATLQINTESSYATENDLPVLSDLTGSNQGRSLVTQTEILQNSAVRARALTLIAPSARDAAAAGSVAVKSIPETDLIGVSATARTGEGASALANAICRAYVDLSREKNRAQFSAARRYVGTQLNDTRARLNAAREALKNYKQQNNTVDLTAETQGQIGESNRLASEIRQARADIDANQSQLARLRGVAATLPATIVSSRTLGQSPALLALHARLTQLELDRIEALKEFVPASPEVQRLNGEIASLKARLSREAKTEVQSSQQAPNPARAEVEQSILRLQGELSSLQARWAALQNLAARVRQSLEQLPEREQKLGQLNTDLDGLELSYKTLDQKYQTLRVSEASKVASGSLLFAAATPDAPEKKLTPFNLAFSLALAALLGLGAIALAEKLDTRVHSAREIENWEEIGDLRVLAQIPANSKPAARSLLNTEAMISPLMENFRMLRTSLAFGANFDGAPGPGGQGARLLAVTSSLPKEGKSLTCLNLAVAAAMSGEMVILVDCDLHQPTLHDLCGRANTMGFIEVAKGLATLESALQSTRVPNLFLLSAGLPVQNPFQILNSTGGRELLERLAGLADLIVVDTPPVLVLADASITASLADSVLLVVSTQEPRRDDVKLAVQKLRQSGAHVAGLVLNKVAPGPDFRDYPAQFAYHLTPDDRLYDSELVPVSSDSLQHNPNSNGASRNGAGLSRPIWEARAK